MAAERGRMLKDSFRKFMVYVGLTEDDYDELGRRAPERAADPEPAPLVEPLNRRAASVAVLDAPAQQAAPPRRPVVRPASPASAVRPITTLQSDEDLGVIAPTSYEESKRIGDDLKARRALVVSLARCDSEVGRRILDFSSGVVYTLGGKISRVAPHVYLLVPPNVRVSPESIDRLRQSQFRPTDG